MASILPIPGLLRKMGVDPSAVIAEAGLSPALFDSPENTIPFADLGRFVALCVMRSDCPYLGLLVGETMGTEVLGLVGQLASCSEDVGSGLRAIIDYLHLHDRGALPAVEIGVERSALVYVIHEPGVLASDQIYDAAMANACNILKALAGPLWEPVKVELTRPRPDEIEPYRRFFGNTPYFGSDRNAVVFPSYWLNAPVRTADATKRRLLMEEIQSLLAQEAGDVIRPLRRLLRRLLIERSGNDTVDLALVAALFAVHPRTLNRRLSVAGTTFKAQLDAARYDIARQLLRDTRLPALKIALTLGYSDGTTFTRAFRRWSGTSPAAWRRAQAGPSPSLANGASQ